MTYTRHDSNGIEYSDEFEFRNASENYDKVSSIFYTSTSCFQRCESIKLDALIIASLIYPNVPRIVVSMN